MILEAAIIGLGIVLAAWLYTRGQERWHIKPRLAKYQVNVVGKTEDSESMTISCTVFNDDPEDVVKAKIDGAFLLREARLQYQNERILALQKEHQAGLERARDERLKKIEEEKQAAKQN